MSDAHFASAKENTSSKSPSPEEPLTQLTFNEQFSIHDEVMASFNNTLNDISNDPAIKKLINTELSACNSDPLSVYREVMYNLQRQGIPTAMEYLLTHPLPDRESTASLYCEIGTFLNVINGSDFDPQNICDLGFSILHSLDRLLLVFFHKTLGFVHFFEWSNVSFPSLIYEYLSKFKNLQQNGANSLLRDMRSLVYDVPKCSNIGEYFEQRGYTIQNFINKHSADKKGAISALTSLLTFIMYERESSAFPGLHNKNSRMLNKIINNHRQLSFPLMNQFCFEEGLVDSPRHTNGFPNNHTTPRFGTLNQCAAQQGNFHFG